MDIDALIVLSSKGHQSPAFRRINPVQALTAIAPNTLIFFHAGSGHLSALKQLVQTVPCFAIDLATDLEANPPAIEALLRSLKSGED